jgi:NADPH-dependent 2,4-dienoyl-CoA reductase/sulfur reductase-like enzyme
MSVEHLVVVGASLAGVRAVEGARAAGFSGRITLLGAEPELPYDRPTLSKRFLLDDAPVPVRLGDVGALHMTLRLGEPARGLDAAARRVLVGDGTIDYDALVVATGATPRCIPGTEDLAGVTPLRTLADAATVRASLETACRVVVIGAGFIGSEVASAARKRGLDTTIVEALPVPLSRSVGAEVGALLTDLHRAAGTRLELGVGVERLLSAGGHVTGVRLRDGRTLAADCVVVGVGVTPATAWLGGAVELHADGGIICDPAMRTSQPGIWAAGDVAHVPQSLFDGDLMRLEHFTSAAEQGALAGRNAVSDAAETLVTVPYFWSDWYDHRIQFVGTPRADEVAVIGGPGSGAVALYRRGRRVVGALAIDRPRDVMKLRRRIADRAPWDEARSFVHQLSPARVA